MRETSKLINATVDRANNGNVKNDSNTNIAAGSIVTKELYPTVST